MAITTVIQKICRSCCKSIQQDLELKLRKGSYLSVAEKIKKNLNSKFQYVLNEHQKKFLHVDAF